MKSNGLLYFFFLIFLLTLSCKDRPVKRTEHEICDTLNEVTIGYYRDVSIYHTTDCEATSVEYWLNEPHDEITVTDIASLSFFETWKKGQELKITDSISNYISTWLTIVLYKYNSHIDTLCLLSTPCHVQLNHKLVDDSTYFYMVNSFLYRNDPLWREHNGWIFFDPKHEWTLIDTPQLNPDIHKTEANYSSDQLIEYVD